MKDLDRTAIEQGAFIWTQTQVERSDASNAEANVWDFIVANMAVRELDTNPASEERLGGYRRRVFVWYTWADAGFPVVEIDREYAAALAASRCVEEATLDLEADWSACLFRLPRDLVSVDIPFPDGNRRTHFDRVWLGRAFAQRSPDRPEEPMLIRLTHLLQSHGILRCGHGCPSTTRRTSATPRRSRSRGASESC